MSRLRARRAVQHVSACLIVLGIIALAPAGATGASGVRPGPMSPNPSSSSNMLLGVAATSRTDAWAVGSWYDDAAHFYGTLVLHWNGTQWSKVGSPNVSTSYNVLTGVRAITATNAWAVGYYVDDSTGANKTLVLRWNGDLWSKVGSPNPSSTQNFLRGVGGGGSAGGIWAVGYEKNDSTGAVDTLALHWNGSKMVTVPSNAPDPATNIYNGVRATASNSAWAVGTAGPNALVSRWNGSTWSRVQSPNPGDTNALMATSGASASDAWAVGYTSTGSAVQTFTVHWNGSKWSTVASPDATAFNNQLVGVRAISATNAWAVGYDETDIFGHSQTLILHWNGADWTQITSPNPGSQNNDLRGIAAVTANDIWAVGSYHDVVAGADKTLILHWNGTLWEQK